MFWKIVSGKLSVVSMTILHAWDHYLCVVIDIVLKCRPINMVEKKGEKQKKMKKQPCMKIMMTKSRNKKNKQNYNENNSNDHTVYHHNNSHNILIKWTI